MGAFLFLMVAILQVFEEFADFSVPAATKFSIRAHDSKTIDLLAHESIWKELRKNSKNEGNGKIVADVLVVRLQS